MIGACPPVLCCVIATPGTASITSVDRRSGRARSSAAPTVPSLAEALTPTRLSARPVTATASLKIAGRTKSTRAVVDEPTSIGGDTCA
jgi:hypothetical protein